MAMRAKLKKRFLLAFVIALALGFFILPRWFKNKSYQLTREPTSQTPTDFATDVGKSPPHGPPPQGKSPTSNPESSQATSQRDQAFAELQSQSSKPWHPVFDSRSGRLRTLEMGRLEIAANDASAGLVDIAQKFLGTHSAGLFGVASEGLRFDRIVESERSKVIFEQYVDGRRVLGATLALVFENGALVRIQSDLVTDAVGRPTGTVIPVEQALSWIEAHGIQQVKPIAEIKPELVYLPHDQQLIVAYAIYADRFNSAAMRIDRVRILVDALSPHIIKTSRMLFN